MAAGQRHVPEEHRVPPGGSLPRGAALEVPDDSLQAWPAASIAAFNGHGLLVRKPHCACSRHRRTTAPQAGGHSRLGGSARSESSRIRQPLRPGPLRRSSHSGTLRFGPIPTVTLQLCLPGWRNSPSAAPPTHRN
jgi:hypothetical protein